jgi:hypothetical protein
MGLFEYLQKNLSLEGPFDFSSLQALGSGAAINFNVLKKYAVTKPQVFIKIVQELKTQTP